MMLCEALQRYMDITLLGATCVLVAELGRVELNWKCHCLGVTPGAHGGQC